MVSQPEGSGPHHRGCGSEFPWLNTWDTRVEVLLQREPTAPAGSQLALPLAFLYIKVAIFRPTLQPLCSFPWGITRPYDAQPCSGSLEAPQEVHTDFQICQPSLKQGATVNLRGCRQPKSSGNFCFVWSETNRKISTALNFQPVTLMQATNSTGLWRNNWADHCSCLIGRTASLVERSRSNMKVYPEFSISAWRQTDVLCLVWCLQQSFASKWKSQSPSKEGKTCRRIRPLSSRI